MLYRLHNNILIIGLLVIGLLASMAMERALSIVSLITLFAYISQLFLLLYFSREKDVFYTNRALFWIVLIYNLILASIIVAMSNLYGGEKFLLSDGDAALYYREGLKSTNLGFIENAKRITRLHPSADWGALIFSSFMMYLIPSRFFVNTFYILTGTVSSVMLFSMGKYFMPKAYAFLAALAYGTSSYLILFHCTYLKESLFLFLIVTSMYCYYKSIIEGKHGLLIVVLICLFCIIFFRPAVAAFLIISFVSYYAITLRGSAISLFLYLTIAVGMVLSLTFLQGQVDHYTAGGDTDKILAESSSGNYSGSFNFFVGWFAALFGPFPTLFPVANPKPMHIYGAGLVYKAFLVIPFWLGVLFAVARWNVRIFPMVMFVVAEMAASAMVLASFELRKVVLHMPFIYVISFYGLSRLKKSVYFSESLKRIAEYACYAFAAGVLFMWTIIREK